MPRVTRCPKCTKLLSIIFPIHDCTEAPVALAPLANPGGKCNGTGWPTTGNDQCLSCGKDNPKVNKRDLVSYHTVTERQYRAQKHLVD